MMIRLEVLYQLGVVRVRRVMVVHLALHLATAMAVIGVMVQANVTKMGTTTITIIALIKQEATR